MDPMRHASEGPSDAPMLHPGTPTVRRIVELERENAELRRQLDGANRDAIHNYDSWEITRRRAETAETQLAAERAARLTAEQEVIDAYNAIFYSVPEANDASGVPLSVAGKIYLLEQQRDAALADKEQAEKDTARLKHAFSSMRIIWWEKDQGQVGVSVKYSDREHAAWIVPDTLDLLENYDAAIAKETK